MIRQWTITGALALVLAALLVNFTQKAVLYNPMDGIRQTGQARTQETQKNTRHKRAWSSAILKKNLFSQSRQENPVVMVETIVEPDPVALIKPASPPAPMPAISLSGIIIDPDGAYTAYIKIGKNPVAGARVGDVMHGVGVITIEERQVELEWKGASISLKMKSSPLLKKR